MEKKQLEIFLTPLSIIVASAIIGGAIYFGTAQRPGSVGIAPAAQSQQQVQQKAPEKTADISKLQTDGRPFIGSAKAPITVAYWYDYQCPFCKRFEETVMPDLLSKYIETGKVRFVYKDFQFLGPDSQTAGLAGRAVWEVAPDKFYEWHKAMYDKQDSENSGWGSKDDIIALTKTIGGIDAQKVAQLMESKKDQYQKIIDDDKAEGSGFGVTGTPGVIIGKQLVVGAQPLAAYTAILDQLLGK